MPPPRDLASRGDDGRCEVRLDTPPFLGEGRLPVRLQQPGEPRDELARVVEEESCRSLGARADPARALQHHRTDLGVGEDLPPRRPPRAAVVVQRPQELERCDLRPQRTQLGELGREVVEGGRGGGEHAVRHRPAVEERERRDLAPQRGREAPHRSHPLVLQRVVLRLDEHVQAEHGLEERRVAERERRLAVV